MATKTFLFIIFLSVYSSSKAQTEFPKEFIAHIRLHSGMVTNNNGQNLFVGGLQIVPQYTIVPFKLRGGLVAGPFYLANKIGGLFGPTISYKLTEFKGGYFGSVANLHINFEHLWGTKGQRLAGAGFNADLLNILIINLSAYRDYRSANWWLQSGISFRISKLKKTGETFPH